MGWSPRGISLVAGAVALFAVSVGSVTGGFAPRAVAADPGPFAEWTFDDGSGTTAVDATGHGHDGVITGGATWLTSGAAQGSGALSFDGIDGLVTVPDSPELEPTSVTLTAWIRSSTPAEWMAVATKGADGCEGASWDLFATGGIGFALGGIMGEVDLPGAGTSISWTSDGGRLWDGEWHLVAYTYDATSGNAHWYIDGRQGQAAGADPTYGLADGNDLTIGGSISSCAWYRHFAGAVDDVRLYRRALSAAEIDDMVPDVATTTTLALPNSPVAYVDQGNLVLTVTVSPPPAGGGIATLYRLVDGIPVAMDSYSIDPVTGGGYLGLSGGGRLPEGDYDVYAGFHDGGTFKDSQSSIGTVQIRREPNSVSLATNRTTAYPGQSVHLSAVTTKNTASIAFWDAVDDGAATLIDTRPAIGTGNGSVASLDVAAPSMGVHHYTAVAAASEAYLEATSPVTTVNVTRRPTATSVGPDGMPQTNHPFTIHVVVVALDPIEPAIGATGDVTLTDGATTIGSAPVSDGEALFRVSSFSLGTHVLCATYAGDAAFVGSTGQVSLEIAADVVEATGIGVQYPTFYPYKDGYLDTDAIRGQRLETASVGIRVYSPTGHVVKSVSIPTGSGSYKYVWNGRTSAGTLLAAGRYRVVQTLTDGAGTKLTVTSYVTLSRKRLYTYSATYTKSANHYTKRTTSWLGWTFTVPSATVYKALVVSVYGYTSMPWAYSPGAFGPQDFSACAYSSYWDPSCVTRYAYLPSKAAWRSVKASPSRDRHGRTVRVYAWAGYGGWAKVGYARIKVTYAILK